MMPLALLLLITGDIEVLESRDFAKNVQVRATTATVRVVNGAKAEGSGALLKRNGPLVYVLTANHVVDGAKRVEVSTYSTASHPRPAATYRADVIAQAGGPDLAVLRFTTADEMPGSVPICPASKVPEGQKFTALSVGCPGGAAPTVALESVQARRRVRRPDADDTVLCWQTEKTPARGRSGGPLLDRRGLLIGLDSGAGDGKGYYVHVEEIHAFLKRNGLEWLYEEKSDK
jgi:S1-C subfamily serine protease